MFALDDILLPPHHKYILQVVRLLGICTQEKPLMIVMEFMARGSLKDVLISSKPTSEGDMEISSLEMCRMCHDVASGMQFLSSKGFVHRDLAARLVTSPIKYQLMIAIGTAW